MRPALLTDGWGAGSSSSIGCIRWPRTRCALLPSMLCSVQTDLLRCNRRFTHAVSSSPLSFKQYPACKTPNAVSPPLHSDAFVKRLHVEQRSPVSPCACQHVELCGSRRLLGNTACRSRRRSRSAVFLYLKAMLFFPCVFFLCKAPLSAQLPATCVCLSEIF